MASTRKYTAMPDISTGLHQVRVTYAAGNDDLVGKEMLRGDACLIARLLQEHADGVAAATRPPPMPLPKPAPEQTDLEIQITDALSDLARVSDDDEEVCKANDALAAILAGRFDELLARVVSNEESIQNLATDED